MKITLLRERKNHPDTRVALTPEQCERIMAKYPNVQMGFEPSPHRCITDQAYLKRGIPEILPEQADILIGIKEVPAEHLLEGKTYLFFSHTIKAQPANQKMFQTALKKGIRLIDYECLIWPKGGRILGFGEWAGINGAWHALRMWGKRNDLFHWPTPSECGSFQSMITRRIPDSEVNLKIALTGEGRVAQGACSLLERMGVEKVRTEDLYTSHNRHVFAQFSYENLYESKTTAPFDRSHFYHNHADYRSLFSPWLSKINVLINGIYWEKDMEPLFTPEQVCNQAIALQCIADISCDVHGSIPLTIRETSIEDPVICIDPCTLQEKSPYGGGGIDLMAVSNLPSELPLDASRDFGEQLESHIIPLLATDLQHPILQRATLCEHGNINPHYDYLKTYGGQ